MINDETKRKLRELKLGEVVAILELQQKDPHYLSQTFDERFQHITDYIYQERINSNVQRLIKFAGFRLPKATIHDIQYEGRGLNRNMILELGTCQFIHNNTNIIFQGFTGSGKTFLACAIGRQACMSRLKVRYARLPDLLIEYDETLLVKKSIEKLLKKYSGYDLLIIDEWLLEILSKKEQFFILELVERRYDSGSTIFCTQYRKEDWHARLGGQVHADSIMDRIVHNAVWIETGPLNMREYYAKNSIGM